MEDINFKELAEKAIKDYTNQIKEDIELLENEGLKKSFNRIISYMKKKNVRSINSEDLLYENSEIEICLNQFYYFIMDFINHQDLEVEETEEIEASYIEQTYCIINEYLLLLSQISGQGTIITLELLDVKAAKELRDKHIYELNLNYVESFLIELNKNHILNY